MGKKLLLLAFILSLLSCNKKEETIVEKEVTKILVDSTVIAPESFVGPETFEDFPEELDGPGCVFSFSEKDYRKGSKYIYADDLDSICYIKVKGNFVRLKLVTIDTSWYPVHYAKKFSNVDYKLSVDVKQVDEEDEVSLLKGTMRIQYKHEPEVKKELYGYCGC